MKNLFILFLLFLGFLSFDFLQAKEIKDKPVRMAYLQSDIHHLPLWVALEKGLFEKEGVEVEIEGVFKAGPEIMSAFAAGALDMAYVGESPATTAVANKATDVVAVSQVNTEGSAIVVRKDSPMTNLRDLVGRIIAVPGHSTVQDFLLRKGLAQKDISLKDLNIIVLKPPEMITALEHDQIDAFIAWEAYPSLASTLGVGRNLATSGDIWPNHPCCVVVAGKKYLESHKGRVKAVVQASINAMKFIHDYPQKAGQIAVKYTGMDLKTVKKAMKNVHYTPKLNRQGELEYIFFLSEFGYIKLSNPDLFVDTFINATILNQCNF